MKRGATGSKRLEQRPRHEALERRAEHVLRAAEHGGQHSLVVEYVADARSEQLLDRQSALTHAAEHPAMSALHCGDERGFNQLPLPLIDCHADATLDLTVRERRNGHRLAAHAHSPFLGVNATKWERPAEFGDLEPLALANALRCRSAESSRSRGRGFGERLFELPARVQESAFIDFDGDEHGMRVSHN